ncbi:hypothetical protein EVAR_19952_1 [Eumeta japonica]|uniref:Uncharacterized protein n=1 Tax=Eumeta variegata TaxID=151549 RepID=A0A4C1YJ58_EUMVA|nr:hypothetical protein EVAR_19952_1 [Eumeta japonica]
MGARPAATAAALLKCRPPLLRPAHLHMFQNLAADGRICRADSLLRCGGRAWAEAAAAPGSRLSGFLHKSKSCFGVLSADNRRPLPRAPPPVDINFYRIFEGIKFNKRTIIRRTPFRDDAAQWLVGVKGRLLRDFLETQIRKGTGLDLRYGLMENYVIHSMLILEILMFLKGRDVIMDTNRETVRRGSIHQCQASHQRYLTRPPFVEAFKEFYEHVIEVGTVYGQRRVSSGRGRHGGVSTRQVPCRLIAPPPLDG